MPDASSLKSAEQIYHLIREQLIKGRYRPGQRINIAGQGGDSGTSATPVREALSRLVGRDLVHKRYREGFYLNRLNARQIAGLYELHGLCVDRLLRENVRVPSSSLPKRTVGIWPVFGLLAGHSADRALVDLQRYLEDRLLLTRQAEQRTLGDRRKSGADLLAALRRADKDTAGSISAAFHTECVDQSLAMSEIINGEDNR